MRSLGLTTVLASLALALVASPSVAGAAGQTRVRLLDTAPLTLRGVGFERWERVRLTVSLGDRSVVRKLRAGAAGGFTTSFEAMRYGRCGPGALTVKAVGSYGSRVSWELVPLECPDDTDS